MTKFDIGSFVGRNTAQAVKRGEQLLGIVGWFGSCVFIAAVISMGRYPESPSAPSIFDVLFGAVPWLALLAVSIHRRGPSRWLEQWGFAFGSRFALVFGIGALLTWLFATDARDAAGLGGLCIICMEMSAALAALAAWLHWDQVEATALKFRRYINGADSAAQRSALDCALVPLWWAMCSLFAAAAALFPNTVMGAVWPPFGTAIAKSSTPDGQATLPPVAMPPVLATHLFWFVIAMLCAAGLYISFRRAGQGVAERGFHLWVYSLAESFCGIVFVAFILIQFQAIDLGRRLFICVVAFAAGGLAWFCDRQRRRMLGR